MRDNDERRGGNKWENGEGVMKGEEWWRDEGWVGGRRVSVWCVGEFAKGWGGRGWTGFFTEIFLSTVSRVEYMYFVGFFFFFFFSLQSVVSNRT